MLNPLHFSKRVHGAVAIGAVPTGVVAFHGAAPVVTGAGAFASPVQTTTGYILMMDPYKTPAFNPHYHPYQTPILQSSYPYPFSPYY